MPALVTIIDESDLRAYALGTLSDEEQGNMEALLKEDESARNRLNQIQAEIHEKQRQTDATLVDPVKVNILVLINEKARRAPEIVTEIKSLLAQSDLDFEMIISSSKSQSEEVIKTRGQEFDAIVIGGGDGTVHSLLSQLLEAQKPVGIIPLGTGNDLARSLNISENLQEAIDVIVFGHTRSIDIGTANGTPFLNNLNIGYAGSIASVPGGQWKKMLGSLSYPIRWIKAWRKRDVFDVDAVIDGENRVQFETDQISVSNSKSFGRHLVIDPTNNLESGRLSFAVMLGNSFFGWLKLGLHLLKGSLSSSPSAAVAQTEDVQIITQPKKRFTLDGEAGGVTPVNVRIKPKALEVFVPR